VTAPGRSAIATRRRPGGQSGRSFRHGADIARASQSATIRLDLERCADTSQNATIGDTVGWDATLSIVLVMRWSGVRFRSRAQGFSMEDPPGVQDLSRRLRGRSSVKGIMVEARDLVPAHLRRDRGQTAATHG
jgi:hypothetical protein